MTTLTMTMSSSTNDEIVFLLIHELIDDLFQPKLNKKMNTSAKLPCSPVDQLERDHEERDDKDVSEEAPFLPDPSEPKSRCEPALEHTRPLSHVPPRRSLPDPDQVPVNLAGGSGKRRRLGVNSGAHEQILRLRDALQYVTRDRDEWRSRCKDAQAKLAEESDCAWRFKLEVSALRRRLEQYEADIGRNQDNQQKLAVQLEREM